MMLQSLTIAAAGLSAANAFLLPPEIRTGFPLGLSIFQEGNRTVSLDCPGCPVPLMEEEGKVHLASGIKSHLELNFRIDNSGKHPRLVANEFEIFPHPDPIHNALIAKHIPEASEDGSAPAPVDAAVPVTLGASLGWHRQPTNKKSPMSHIVVDLQIIEILSGFQDGIPNIKVDLIHCGHSGRLRIANIRQTESTARMHVPLAQQLTECGESVYCKVRAIMMDKLQKVSGALGKMNHKGCKMHHGGHHAHQMGGMGGHHGHHEHHGHHGHMKGEHLEIAENPLFKLREHSWSQLLNKFVHNILFPVGVGIVAGITVSIIGMAIGTLLVGLWRVVVRGQPFFHRRRHSHRRSKSAVADEKAALMANIEENVEEYKDDEPKENN